MSRARSSSVVLLICALPALLGCGAFPHLTLSAPPPTAPLEVRREAYRNLVPLGAELVSVYVRGAYRGTFTSYMRLGSGDEVRAPEDLLPVVPNPSRTARAARESVGERERGTSFRRWGWASIGTGLGGGFFGIIFAQSVHEDAARTGASVAVGVTAGALLVTGIVLLFVSSAHSAAAENARARAFGAYERDLRTRLGLCPRDGDLVDCGGAQ